MTLSSALRPFTAQRGAAILAILALMSSAAVKGATLLQDSFLNGIKATPDFTTIGNWTFSDPAVTEVNGTLTVATTSSAVSISSNFSTTVQPDLNPFTSSIQFSVTDFTLGGTGDYAAAGNGRFRMGLTSTLGSFFGANDAFALEINNNGLGFRLGTKFDNSATDPGGLVASSSALASAITGFDFTFTATTWALVLYSGVDTLFDQSGTWSLGNADTWGTGTGNTGASSLLLAVQNTNAPGTPTGFKSFSIGDIVVTASPIPEPSRMLLLGLGCCLVVMRRQRVKA